jgi:hypothetical protein
MLDTTNATKLSWLGAPKLCHVGGNANNGSNCGSFYVNSNNSFSNSNTNYASRTTIVNRCKHRGAPTTTRDVRLRDVGR